MIKTVRLNSKEKNQKPTTDRTWRLWSEYRSAKWYYTTYNQLVHTSLQTTIIKEKLRKSTSC